MIESYRTVMNGARPVNISESVEDRFFCKVNKDGPLHRYDESLGKCWDWMASKTQGGYGRMAIGINYSVTAHRVSLLIHLGDIPPGFDVAHSCNRPCCVNPDHLKIQTRTENIAYMDETGRRVNKYGDDNWTRRMPHLLKRGVEHPGHGENNNFAKNSAETVIRIRQLHRDGFSYPEIAKIVGLGRPSVWAIVKRKTWAWLE